MAKGHNQNGATNEPDALFEREDWTQFRALRTISQLSGVPQTLLRRLIAKELADNALDASGNCRVGELGNGGFYVEDDGPGIPGKPEEIARLFSFRRPLMSSKIKRMPTRGALGNGLRVVPASVFASAGRLVVSTRGRTLHLQPEEDGTTTIVRSEPWKEPCGSRIDVFLGDAVPYDSDPLQWARDAIRARGKRPIYSGKTSPWWYDSDAFFELLRAAGERTIREVMHDFDGCAERLRDFPSRLLARPAHSITYKEIEHLLTLARSFCRPAGPDVLHLLKSGFPGSYAKCLDTLILKPGRGGIAAEIPYTVEVWRERRRADEKDSVAILVNRSPVTGDVLIERAEKQAQVRIFGCNLGYCFTVGRKPVAIIINVQSPYMPITSNGKEPDLEEFIGNITPAVETAAKKCQRENRTSSDRTGGILPSLPKGRPNDEQRARYKIDLDAFADRLKKMNSSRFSRVFARLVLHP